MKQTKLYKERSLIYRYPRATVAVVTTASLLILMSKPIYDFCFADLPQVDAQEMLRTHRTRFGKS